MSAYSVEPGKQADLAPCSCCGGRTRVVRGFVYRDGEPFGVYLVRWVPERPEHGASALVVLGAWGEGAGPEDRRCVAIEAREHGGGPAFRVVDAGSTPWASDAALGRLTTRAEVMASPLSREAFDVLDAAGAEDARLEGWGIVMPRNRRGRME